MNKRIRSLYDFISEVSHNTIGINIDLNETDKITDFYRNEIREYQPMIEWRSERYKKKHNIHLTESQKQIFHLCSTNFRWRRPGRRYKNGGFCFNGLTDIFAFNPKFWEGSVRDFTEEEQAELIDFELLNKLRWIDSLSPETNSEYTPQYGCVLLEPGKFPDQFYYYDSGFAYPLLFTTYGEYIEAMIQTAAVRFWQYFYINPELIIRKNKGLRYITWDGHSTNLLDENLRDLTYKADAKYDRLDMIHDNLATSIEVLPQAFPFLSFEHHKAYFERFDKLYKESQAKN